MKKVFAYVLLIFIIIVIISLVVMIDKKIAPKSPSKTDEKVNKLAILNNVDKRIDYFKYQYLDRYINYKEKNPTLSDIDIITRVNLNLDQSYYLNTRQAKDLNKTTILVNKYTYLPNNYVPNNLSTISSEYSSSTRQLVYEAKESFEELCLSAKKEGYQIRAISAYRSYEYQEQLYNNYVKKDGQLAADNYSARPGHSEHQTGLVVDIDNGITNYENFENTDEFIWMQEHAHEYGFILRYPKEKENITGYDYESWHYRYVGKENAIQIINKDLTFDEYYIRYIEK